MRTMKVSKGICTNCKSGQVSGCQYSTPVNEKSKIGEGTRPEARYRTRDRGYRLHSKRKT